MKNTLYEGYLGPRLPQKVQMERINLVIREELTQRERETLFAYYFSEMSLTEIAREQGINKSTVCRTLKRAERRLRRFLRY